ncbi:MAG: tetratricopeptide repeat protein [Gemmatales bacterium]|nr:tetratricopeptide repeat protein [Gemmatales bacterium]MDW8175656.1 tetratricopeptide repeat protein [Gemmatales bacterium]
MTHRQAVLMVTPEQRRVATQQFERARQLIQQGGRGLDYALSLLLECCRVDPANLEYRQHLRQVQKARLRNRRPWSWWAWLKTMRHRAKMQLALQQAQYAEVLALGEKILSHHPWDVGALLVMAQAAEALELNNLAAWLAESACAAEPEHVGAHRRYAQLCERLGDFQKAVKLWAFVASRCPTDEEAHRKQKDLAAMETITRGGYERNVAPGQEPATTATGSASSKPAEAVAPIADPTQHQIDLLHQRIAQDPTQVSHYLSLADLYKRRGKLDDAVRILQQGLNRAGPQFELNQALAEIEIETLRNNLRIANRRAEENPQDELAKQLREQLALEILRREMDFYRARLDRYPNDNAARVALATRLLLLGLVDEAIREFQLARKDPKHASRALMGLGKCFLQKKNLALARRNFQEALDSLPASDEELRKELLYELAVIAAKEKDYETAIRLGTEVANLDYFYRDIGKLLEQWQAESQRPH